MNRRLASGVLAATLSVWGCRASDHGSGGTLSVPTESSAPVTFFPGPIPAKPPIVRRMKEHAIAGAAARDAVAGGDLSRIRSSATALLELAGSIEPGATMQPKLDRMKIAAQRMVDAVDGDSAAHAFGSLAEACGSCHADFGGPIVLPARSPNADPAARMTLHQWAVQRMWEGLVGPSDDAWTSGAQTLARSPLEPGQVTPGQSPAPRIVALADSVHQHARRAVSLQGDARAYAFGDVMSSCATCHAWLGGGPQSAKR